MPILCLSQFPGECIFRGEQRGLPSIILESHEIHRDKGPSSQGYGFSNGHVGCKSWTVKKAEHRRIDAFELCGVGEDS